MAGSMIFGTSITRDRNRLVFVSRSKILNFLENWEKEGILDLNSLLKTMMSHQYFSFFCNNLSADDLENKKFQNQSKKLTSLGKVVLIGQLEKNSGYEIEQEWETEGGIMNLIPKVNCCGKSMIGNDVDIGRKKGPSL